MNQDDFRRLLDSGGSGGGGGRRGKSGASGGKINLDMDDIRKLSAKKSSKKKGSKSHKERDNDADDHHDGAKPQSYGGQYRDRAAERRQGIKVDEMEDVDDYKHLDAEQSKFLGGDLAHTHLVKGLDFALLAQLKREKQKLELATAAERLKIHGGSGSAAQVSEQQQQQQQPEAATAETEVDILTMEPTFQTRLGRMVYFHACQNQPLTSNGAKKPVAKSELFLPGRMFYTFNLSTSELESKPVVVQRSKDDCPERDDVVSGALDDSILVAMQRIMEQKKAGKKMRRKRPEDLPKEATAIEEDRGEEKETEESKMQPVDADDDDDDDDDIFPDAGDYVPAYLREGDKPETPVLAIPEDVGYFTNLSASISEAEKAARQKELDAETAWKVTLEKAVAAQAQVEEEAIMKERAEKMAAAQDSYGEYDMGGDSDEEENDAAAGKKRKGADAKKDAASGVANEIDGEEKNRRKKQKQGNKLENDLKKINKIMESKK